MESGAAFGLVAEVISSGFRYVPGRERLEQLWQVTDDQLGYSLGYLHLCGPLGHDDRWLHEHYEGLASLRQLYLLLLDASSERQSVQLVKNSEGIWARPTVKFIEGTARVQLERAFGLVTERFDTAARTRADAQTAFQRDVRDQLARRRARDQVRQEARDLELRARRQRIAARRAADEARQRARGPLTTGDANYWGDPGEWGRPLFPDDLRSE